MRNTDVRKLVPIIVREVMIPADRVKSLTRRTSAVQFAQRFLVEMIERIAEDAEIVEMEAWDECAKIAGFASLVDAESQGFTLTRHMDGTIQVRKGSNNDTD